jgi:hypothetical protein
MFRTTAHATRTVPRTLLRTANVPSSRPTVVPNVLKAALKTSAKSLTPAGPLSLALREPLKRSLVRYQSTAYQAASFAKGLSKEAEAAYLEEKLAPEPAEVSSSSSVHQIRHEKGVDNVEEDIDMTASIKSDFVC